MMPGARVGGGAAHTCQLDAAGAAFCWGSNSNGQLGDGTTTGQATPVAVSGGLSFGLSLATGGAHSCGVTHVGTAYCWGGNSYGQLGDGTATDQATPVAVGGATSFVTLTAGRFHTCGLTGGGTAYCWGWNRYGQLGNGTTAEQVPPVEVNGGLSFVALSAGERHTCGLTSGGTMYCWGGNEYGQLGDGTSGAGRTMPVAMSGGLSFISVAAGLFHHHFFLR